MGFPDDVTEYAGLPVVEFPSFAEQASRLAAARRRARQEGAPVPDSVHDPDLAAALADPSSVAWRLGFWEYGVDCFCFWWRDDCACTKEERSRVEDRRSYLERFLDTVGGEWVTALVVGALTNDVGTDTEADRDLVLEVADRLPRLRSLYFGDYPEGTEISWIEQTDIAPLLAAFPGLTELTVCGGDPTTHVPEHASLRSLTLRSGGLGAASVRGVLASGLPALEHLELWLGVEMYGGSTTLEDLAPLLSGEAFPRLRHLGLRNAEDTNALVRALADAPVTRTLHTLDLSMGTLRDKGASVLLDSPVFRGLERLDLHHHYLSEEIQERVRAEFTAAGVETDVGDRREVGLDDDFDEDDEYFGHSFHFYPAVTE